MSSTISYLTNIYLRTPNNDFPKTTVFEPGLLFWRGIFLFPNLSFSPLFLQNPTTQMCVSIVGLF